jgi:predicted nucleotidyltransferase
MYFCKDSELNKKAEEIVFFCKDALMKMYVWNDIIGIILTGSFARGEGSIIKHGDGSFHVLGDIELMVVLLSKKSFTEKYSRLKKISKQIAYELLRRGIYCEIDLSPVSQNYFKNAKPIIFNIELRENGQHLYGDVNFLNQMPAFRVSDIPKDDALNLLSNRIIEQLILYKEVTSSHEINFAQSVYQLTKLYMDIGGSFLAFTGNYTTTYSKRVMKLRELSDRISKNGFEGIDLRALYHKVTLFTEIKLFPKSEYYFPTKSTTHDVQDKKEFILMKIIAAVDDVKDLWIWEMTKIYCLQQTDLKEILERLQQYEKLLLRLKGWLKLIILHCNYMHRFSFSRVMKLLFLGSPRNLINICAAQSYFSLNESNIISNSAQDIRDLIPVLYDEKRDSVERLTDSNITNIIKNWEIYLKNF